MKKNLLFIVFVFLACSGFAQEKTVKDIFTRFEGKEGINVINLDKDMLGAFIPQDSANANLKGITEQITALKIMIFEKASAEDKASFAKQAKEFALPNFRTFLAKENNQEVKILLKETGNKITEFIIFAYEGKDLALISIIGNMDNKVLDEIKNKMHLGEVKLTEESPKTK
ncbi:MAG: DUF4252 domain-containing protein [Bacteroidota bacterium]|nr:DUF4252 domain-containing protein [Bacteroidota bacterium]